MSIRLLGRISSNIVLNKIVLQKHYSIVPILTFKYYYSKIESEFLYKNYNNTNNHGTRISPKLSSNIKDEKDDLFFMKNDPDKFGTTTTNTQIVEHENDDPGDIEEEEYIQNPPKKSQQLRLKEYEKMIKEHLDNHRIKEAIDILEIRMLKEDRVKPGKYIFKILISGCAKVGYTKKAFQLYNKMKQRDLKITPSIYTSLFNACANSPYLNDSLQKANRLREIMLEKNYIPNLYNYNAMIKAYGRCGDIKTAYQIADEILERNLQLNTDTFNFLLQACASDIEYGFRHALLTWHKMLNCNLKPDIYSFNLMLRCTRDCSIGDLETMEDVLMQILSRNFKKFNKNDEKSKINNDKENVKVITDKFSKNNTNSNNDERNETQEITNLSNNEELNSTSERNTNEIQNQNNLELLSTTTQIVSPTIVDETPNLLCNTPHLGSLISISEIKKPEDRLLLLGGFTGFLEEMKKLNITPGIETFTALLEVIPSTVAAEKKLISMIRKIGLKADIDFFNILIKKRCMRFDYVGGREVLNMIKTAKLQPDIITYGVLALGCQTQDEARELLNEMRTVGIKMNIQILGAMLRQGCAHKNFKYINEILQITLDEHIKPNEEFLKHLDNFNKGCKKMLYQKHPLTQQKSFKKNFDKFKEKLNIWSEEWDIKDLKIEDAIKKIKEKPYQQFKEEQQKGFENLKNEKLLKKQKIRKYIKRIKIKDEAHEQNYQQQEMNNH